MPIYQIRVVKIGMRLYLFFKKNLFQNIKVNFPNVKQALLRSDEAGCYPCHHLIVAVKDIGDRVGTTVARYDFSEAQQGKDVCDRVLCPMKAAIRKHIARKAITS